MWPGDSRYHTFSSGAPNLGSAEKLNDGAVSLGSSGAEKPKDAADSGVAFGADGLLESCIVHGFGVQPQERQEPTLRDHGQ